MVRTTIQNGQSTIAEAIRYYGYKLAEEKLDKYESISNCLLGNLISRDRDEVYNTTYEYMLDIDSTTDIYYGETCINIRVIRDGNTIDELSHKHLFPTYINMDLDINYDLDHINTLKKCQNILDNFIKDSIKYYNENIKIKRKKNGRTGIYMFDEYVWDLLNSHPKRNIDTIHLDGEERKILKYLKSFKSESTRTRYESLGIPYKRNILFEGYPGTGKTSLIYALAGELDMDVCIINFNKDIDDNVFMRSLRKLKDDSILVFEDIDVLFKERKENDSMKSLITFSGLLNTLDGMAYREGLIVFMTTNYECNLDLALKRPGRIDRSLHFGFCNKNQVKEMYKKFYPDYIDDYPRFWKEIKGLNFTTAMLQQYFIWHMDDDNIEELLENISEFKDLCSKHNYDKKLDLYM